MEGQKRVALLPPPLAVCPRNTLRISPRFPTPPFTNAECCTSSPSFFFKLLPCILLNLLVSVKASFHQLSLYTFSIIFFFIDETLCYCLFLNHCSKIKFLRLIFHLIIIFIIQFLIKSLFFIPFEVCSYIYALHR